MTSQLQNRIAGYILHEPLGQGGMGVVYRAEHEATGEMVALKTVLLAKRTMLASIRREIRALARLKHSGIVEIVEHGIHLGLPWYAMRFLHGSTLRHIMHKRSAASAATDTDQDRTSDNAPTYADRRGWWTHTLAAPLDTMADIGQHTHNRSSSSLQLLTERSPSHPRESHAKPIGWQRAVDILAPLTDALAYLHSAGLVHRDLKPENILLTTPTQPVLIDFGLASDSTGTYGREKITDMMPAAGTVFYMSPEQLEGTSVDARADLYALGCIFYELVTGTPPFNEASRAQMMLKHLRQRPKRPSEIEGISLPPPLEHLIMRLLEKSPEARPGYAADVFATLLPFMSSPNADPSRYPPHLYRPVLAGRSTPLDQLVLALNQTLRGQGTLALIGGESGVGKTRLALECAQRAHGLQIAVFSGTCAPFGKDAKSAALAPLRNVFRSVLEESSLSQALFSKEGRLLAQHLPELAAHPRIQAQPKPPALPPIEALLRLYVTLTRVVEHISRRRPILLILDDLQWADALTLGWLNHLARGHHERRCGLMLLGTYRSEEPRKELLKLTEHEDFEHIVLKRLDEEGVERMISSMLALDDVPPRFVRALHQQAHGNPFFVAEYLRTAVAEGILDRALLAYREQTPSTSLGEMTDALPASLHDLLHQRISRLSDAARDVAQFASVLGREFPFQLLDSELHAVTGETLDELVARNIFEFTIRGDVRFVHDKLREALLDALDEHQHTTLHRDAAQRFEIMLDTDPTLRLHCVHHFEHAGEIESARTHAQIAAQEAEARYELEEAKLMLRTAIRLADAELGNLHHSLARVLFHSGRTREALDEAEQALALSHDNSPLERARMLMLNAEILSVLGQLDSAQRALDQATHIVEPLDEVLLQGRLLVRLGDLHRARGELDRASETLEHALELLRTTNDRKEEASALNNLANVLFLDGQHAKAQNIYRQALDIHEREGHRRETAIVLTNLANSLQKLGEPARAQRLHERALRLYQQIGARRHEGTSLNNLAICHHSEGRIDKSHTLLEQALEIHHETGDYAMEGLTLSNLAAVLNEKGQIEAARQHLENALDIQRDIGNPRAIATVLAHLAVLRASCGLVPHARRAFQEAIGQHERADAAEDADATRIRFAVFLRRIGHHQDALELLTRVQTPHAQAEVAVQRGHLALAVGNVAQKELETAENLARNTLPEAHPAHRAIERLIRAINAWEHELEPLFQGELREDVPERLRAVLD